MKRRDFVAKSLAAAASSLLSGCANYPMVRNPAEVCSPDFRPEFDSSGQLQIDVHCHVFNASDLPVQGFVGEVLTHDGTFSPDLGRYVAAVLQSVADDFAPSAKAEANKIAKFLNESSSGPSVPKLNSQFFEPDLQEQDRAIEEEIRRALNASPELRERLRDVLRYDESRMRQGAREGPSIEQGLLPLLQGPMDTESFLALQASPSIRNAHEFLKPMLRFRYTNCYALMKAFSCKPGEVDLYVPSLVDFNYWLGPADTWKSPLEAQLDAMEQAMRLMGGTVHCFAPFNPWAHIRNPKLFAVLTDAIERRGFIGFKLYPPMGFAPWGNQKLGENERPPIWSKQGPEFPRELDDSMMTLFTWCSNNDVPIMAHANPSDGPDEHSEVMGSPKHWRWAYEQMASAGIEPPAISFGHFGGDKWSDENRWGGEFAKLFLEQPRAYADLSYWEHMLDPPESDDYGRVVESLKTAFRSNTEAKNRLTYGTDWNMLAIEDRWQGYFGAFRRVLAAAAGSDSSITPNVGGLNASRYLGLLNSGRRNNRARLLEFYARWGIPAPSWATKTGKLV